MKRNPVQYHVVISEDLPTWIRVRDIVLTVMAWAFWFYICWDVIIMLELGLIREFDADPSNNMDWELLSKQLSVSYTFSGIVIAFLVLWGVFNTLLIAKMVKNRQTFVTPITLQEEASTYDCNAEDVALWRKEKIVTVSIDDIGRIQHIEPTAQHI